MHGIQGENAPFHQRRGQQWLERADLILLLLYIAVPQDDARGHLITTELMHGLRLPAWWLAALCHRSPDEHDPLVLVACVSVWVRLHSEALLPISQKIWPGSRPDVRHPRALARCSTSSGTACPFGAVQTALPGQQHDGESTRSRYSNSFLPPVSLATSRHRISSKL